jgi:hypothetical protein
MYILGLELEIRYDYKHNMHNIIYLGETPDFEHHMEHKFDWGLIDIHIDAKVCLLRHYIYCIY